MSITKHISAGSPFESKLGYSRAVIKGNWCFVSGVTGYDYTKMEMPVSAAEQAKNCFETISNTLQQGDFSLHDIVRVTYILTSSDMVDEIAATLKHYMGSVRPAATMVISGLIKPEMLIEIEVTAFKG